MLPVNTCACTYSRLFSEIKGLQSSRTLTYSLATTADGALLSLQQTTAFGVTSESCLCPGLSPGHAAEVLQYLYENGMDFDGWLDMLDDLHILHCPA